MTRVFVCFCNWSGHVLFLVVHCVCVCVHARANTVQINLYLLSRILYALVKLMVKRGYTPQPDGPVFPWFAAVVWGIVLWLFEHEADTLQPSLKSSMTYLYHDSNTWNTLRNFLWHNK